MKDSYAVRTYVRTGERDRMCVCGCVCVFAPCAQNIFWCYMKNNHLIVFVHNLVEEIFNLSFSWYWLKHAEKVTSNVSCAMFCSVHIIPVWFVCTMYIVHKHTHPPNTELWQLSAQREVWDKHRGFRIVLNGNESTHSGAQLVIQVEDDICFRRHNIMQFW